MTDHTRELLELAAKACGIPIHEWCWRELDATWHGCRSDSEEATVYWSSLTDDGDCARMEAQLDIDVVWHENRVACYSKGLMDYANYYDHAGDKQAARRMASTRAAAEIGRRMK